MLGLLQRLFGSERRQHDRRDCRVPAAVHVHVGGAHIPGAVGNISSGGCLFHPDGATPLLPSSLITLSVGDHLLPCVIVRQSLEGYHCRFHETAPADLIEAFVAAYAKAGRDRGPAAA